MFYKDKTDNTMSFIKEIEHVQNRIKYAENMFDFAKDPEVIESAILEIQSARKMYNYLFKKIKDCNM